MEIVQSRLQSLRRRQDCRVEGFDVTLFGHVRFCMTRDARAVRDFNEASNAEDHQKGKRGSGLQGQRSAKRGKRDGDESLIAAETKVSRIVFNLTGSRSPARRDTCIALLQRYIKRKGLEQLLEYPRPYPQHDGMEQKNES